MAKIDDIREERERLAELFDEVDPKKRELIQGLLDDAAFLAIENTKLKATMVETGMVKIHPVYHEIQKPVEAARQYRQNVNTYAVIIKTLNGVISKDAGGEDDVFEKWIKEKRDKPTK